MNAVKRLLFIVLLAVVLLALAALGRLVRLVHAPTREALA
jgi:hypothetical protein